MRTTLDAAAAGVNGRVSALRVDTAVEGVGVDAVVLVPTHAAGLEARLQRTLGERLGRPVAVRVREVLTADDATVARQQGTLAELKRSVLALQDADPAQQAGLEPQAWALQRWRATRVDVVLAGVDDATRRCVGRGAAQRPLGARHRHRRSGTPPRRRSHAAVGLARVLSPLSRRRRPAVRPRPP